MSYALKGNNVHCPCCESSFVTFLPAGLQKRSNAKCTQCSSLERHRIIWMYLKNKTNFFKQDIKVLHVAPEHFFYEKFSELTNLNYTAIDKYPEQYGYGRNTIQMDITDLQFADNTFDVIMCNHVLEHVEDDKKGMSEFFRVLKPGGWAILNSPVDQFRAVTFEDASVTKPSERLRLFGQQDHVRVYGTDYTNRLSDAGFKVEVIDFAATFSHNDRFKYGMKDGEEIYRCSK